MRQNPVRFGECCDKCGMPRMSCVCVRNIKVTPKKSVEERLSELSAEARKAKIQEVIDFMLSIVDWESDETFSWIVIIRKEIFKRYGPEYLEYLDNQIATLGGRKWGRSTEQPEAGEEKK